ncbi:hypothetical protein HIR71_03200 [Cellulomonas fimi]|uniref:Uncharacterized protein n=1 Tax=Cellulomonas fimi TaxID=1708 RepID=A0A7Y0QHJ7_CELFI|nr:hypothetical protein [Cellulomonas fimi]
MANREVPRTAPVRPMGEIPVIAHVVWEDGAEEWRAPRAIRWTPTHVMVSWRDDPAASATERFEWLRANDVMRSVSWFVPPVKA